MRRKKNSHSLENIPLMCTGFIWTLNIPQARTRYNLSTKKKIIIHFRCTLFPSYALHVLFAPHILCMDCVTTYMGCPSCAQSLRNIYAQSNFKQSFKCVHSDDYLSVQKEAYRLSLVKCF